MVNLSAQRTVVIPARLESSRLPRKLLVPLGDQPIIVRTMQAAMRSTLAERVLVATDSPEIAAKVQAAGGEAVMTPNHFSNGTERVAWVARELGLGTVIDLQGDEPLADPALIDRLFELLERHPATVATAVFPATRREQVTDPSVVKAVLAEDGRVLYFSRAGIPYPRESDPPPENWLLHIGIYGYAAETLCRIAALPPSPAEQLEKLEQLRWLHHGQEIRAICWSAWSAGVDTQEDYERVVKMMG